MPGPLRPPAAALVLGLAVAGCQQKPPAPPPPPPAKVTVSQPAVRPVTEYGEYTGYLDAVQRVEIRPQIKGRILKVHFKEGTEIAEGTLLYEIDPEEYRVARDQAKAALDVANAAKGRAEAEVVLARSNLARTDIPGTSQQEKDQAGATLNTSLAAVKQADAAIDQAKATLAAADLNLKYTKIYAPISGRVSRTLVTAGNLVGYDAAQGQLTVMVDQDPIYVFFDVPERDAIRYERRARENNLPLWSAGKIPIKVAVETEAGFPHKGVLNFRDPRFEPGTGTIRLRGVLDNPTRTMSSGMFAKVRFPIGETRDRLMLPVTAVLSDQRGRYVLVVGADNVVQDRTVTLGPQVGALVAIETGLKADEWVVTEGVQKARPKATVQPEQKPLPAADPPKK